MGKINLQPSLETTKNDPNGSQVNLLDKPPIPFYKNPKFYLKMIILTAIIAFITVAIIYRHETGEIFTSFLTWFSNNLLVGAITFMGIYWIATVAFIPGSLLTFGAGFVFGGSIGIPGIFIATLVVWLGAALGASSAFLLGRFVFREGVAGFKEKSDKFDLIDKVVTLNGFKVTLLLRLSPIVPFNLFNYFMGLTGVSFNAYNAAHVGMIPGTLAYCFIGGTLGSLAEAGSVGFKNPIVLIVAIVGTIITVIGMVIIGLYGKKQFSKLAAEVKEKRAKEEETTKLGQSDELITEGNNTEGNTNNNKDATSNNDIENPPQYDDITNNDIENPPQYEDITNNDDKNDNNE